MVWVNGKILDTSQPKARQWNPPPQPPREVFGTCEDCGGILWKIESCWTLPNKRVCIENECWLEYYERGEGFHDCCGLTLPGLALEG